MTNEPKYRLYAAVSTPFDKNNNVDIGAMALHSKWLIEEGCDGLVIFGSTGEAVSLTMQERVDTLSALIEEGIPSSRLLIGTGCCAIADTVELSTHALKSGCHGVLIMPPFLFKGLSDEGLQETFRKIIQGVGADDLKIYLYHFPALSGVKFTSSLVNKLMAEFPNNIVGYKDSGGDWENTKDIIDNCKALHVYSGSEIPLSDVLKHGGAGCISATANTQAKFIKAIIEAWYSDDDQAMQVAQEHATVNRMILQDYSPMAAAVKSSVASISGNDIWLNIRPPLVSIPEESASQLMGSLKL